MNSPFPASITVDKLKDVVPLIAAHLDLEGFAYIKVTRIGKTDCFAADVTMQVLTNEGGNPPMTRGEVAKLYWEKPANQKMWRQ
jgi:hypothetical protein